MTSSPELSVVLVTDSPPALRKVLRCYAAQCGSEALEIVIAALSGADAPPGAFGAEGFARVRILDARGCSLGLAEAQAVRAATAPWLVFAQAHAYPRPGFVAALRAAQSGAWAVIGPMMANANPESGVSRAAMRIHYGLWTDLRVAGPAATVPGHNSAYRRDALLALGDELPAVLEAGSALQDALRARGQRFLLEPAACVEIVNVSRLGWYLVDMFRQGRVFAGMRWRTWSTARRILYCTGSPLIPVVRLARMRAAARPGDGWSPALVLVGLAASATGEMVGYLAGPPASERLSMMTLHRRDQTTADDRRRDADERTWPVAHG